MPFAQRLPNLATIYVSGDWTDATVVAADVANQWSIDPGSTHTFTVDLWEGPSDSDDYATFVSTAGTPSLSTAFDSAPAVGTLVYVLSIRRS